MIRTALVLFIIGAVAVAALALMGDAGHASLVWLGWRLDMTAATAVLIVLFAALLAAVFWRLVLWVASAPQRSAQARAEQRRQQGQEALARGFLAAAAGDGSEARRLAQKALDLAGDNPALARILQAQAAEAAGDLAAAKQAYTSMLDYPDMRLAALRGLMNNAAAQGDRAGALRYAQEAYSLARTARWAWSALLENRFENGDWAGALDLVKTALDRKIVSPIVADRARAALLAASAANLEERRGQQALDFATQAAKLKPGFAPAVIIAARLLAEDGKQGRAASVIEHGWKEEPHPAMWLFYRDLITAETPRERARRLSHLAGLNAESRESRILSVEQALIAGAAEEAQAAAKGLEGEPLTARLAGLYARLAYARGDADSARLWMAKGADAPHEPDWSDIDPQGRAFVYTASDWARLVSAYAETGELIHPRFERRDPVMSDLPRMPVAYPSSQTFVSAAESGAAPLPIADDPGFYAFDDAGDEPPKPQPASPRRRGSFGRGRR